VQECPKRALDKCRRLFELQIAHVALAQIELHSSLGRARARLLEHRRRRVDPHDAPASRTRNRDRDAAVPGPVFGNVSGPASIGSLDAVSAGSARGARGRTVER
jgi:hypothetical protein